MKQFFSISNDLVKLTKLDIPRMTDSKGENPGIQTIKTHSTQISWQFQVRQLVSPLWGEYSNGDWVVMAVESYSRYTLIMPYSFKPDWSEIENDFSELYLEHMLNWMQMGGFIKTESQFKSVIDQYILLKSDECYRNLDRSIGGLISDNFHWLSSYLDEMKPRSFGAKEAWELSEHLNQLPRRMNKQRGKKHEFLPIERFLDDSLYRFAGGLCDQSIPGYRIGNFPNPHRKPVNLSVV